MAKRRKRFSYLRFNVHRIIDLVAIVFVWRGVWHLADRYLFPGNPVLSDASGLVAGLFILLLDNILFDEIDEHP